jgi:hypothetical protein
MLTADKGMEQIQKDLPKAKLQPPPDSNPFSSGGKRNGTPHGNKDGW